MFAITADQIGSRHGADLVDDALAEIERLGGSELLLPPDRSAGDELQVATSDAGTALQLVLHLTRAGVWSVGLGIGAVRHPLPEVTRAVAGPAFELARTAVEAAKKRPDRFAVGVETGHHPDAATLQPLIDLLLQLRARRTREGWELFDLLGAGLTQAAAAARLGITPQAVSLRAQAAQLRTELAAHQALTTLLTDAGDRIGVIFSGFLSLGVWITDVVLVFGALALTIVARRLQQPLLALVALLPVIAGIIIIAFQLHVPAPVHALNVLLAFGFAGLGVAAGSPLTSLVLERATRGESAADGQFGGILVKEKGERSAREVLRGGAAIGYLERLAVVAAIVVGHPEVIAAVIAVKGLGRFSELDSAEARERFIIGTLTSLIWAAVCAALIILPGGALS